MESCKWSPGNQIRFQIFKNLKNNSRIRYYNGHNSTPKLVFSNHVSSKIKSKNLDMIVLNSLQDSGAGFGHDTNKISIIKKDGTMVNFDLKSKQDVAMDIVEMVVNHLIAPD